MLNPRCEALGSGVLIFMSVILFYLFEPWASVILVDKLLKFVCYSCAILGLNLWLRFKARFDGIDPDSNEVLKNNIRLTFFMMVIFTLMEIGIIAESLA